MAVTSPASLIPMAAAVHGMGAPVTTGRPRTGPSTRTDQRAQLRATRAVARDVGALRVPGRAPLDDLDRDRRVGATSPDRPLTLVEDTGLVIFNALPAETPAARHDGSDQPLVGQPTFTEPIEPVTAPATAITQGASIPAGSVPGPAAGTASTTAWWSSSASPRSA